MGGPMSESCSSKPVTSGCGCGAEVKFDGATPAYRRALAWVIAINVVGFVVVLVGGLLQGSASLSANALDFLADSATYAISLWAIGRSVAVRTGAALFKGVSLGVVALSVVGFAAWRAWSGAAPSGEAISALGLFGALANLIAAGLLVRYRDGDANVRSVWLCTRNDLIECLGVAVAGGLVWLTGSRWPDLIVGVFLAGVFLSSAYQIIRQARAEHRADLATS
ncbi:cation transporter [soil metagenome]